MARAVPLDAPPDSESTGLRAKLALVEGLLAEQDARSCAVLALRWLSRHAGVRRGHREELRAWVSHLLTHGSAPSAADTFLASTEANLVALESAVSGRPVTIFRYGFQSQPAGESICASD